MNEMTDDQILDRLRALDAERELLRQRLAKNSELRLGAAKARGLCVEDLVCANEVCCSCGALMAYPKDIGPYGQWDCAAVLLGATAPPGQPGAVEHSGGLSFTAYEIKSWRRERPPTLADALGNTRPYLRVRPG